MAETEKDYQAYIDQLHAQIAELSRNCDMYIHRIADLENRLVKTLDENDKYRNAILNFFIKWGATNG